MIIFKETACNKPYPSVRFSFYLQATSPLDVKDFVKTFFFLFIHPFMYLYFHRRLLHTQGQRHTIRIRAIYRSTTVSIHVHRDRLQQTQGQRHMQWCVKPGFRKLKILPENCVQVGLNKQIVMGTQYIVHQLLNKITCVSRKHGTAFYFLTKNIRTFGPTINLVLSESVVSPATI